MTGRRPAAPRLERPIRRAVYDHVYAHDDHEVGGVLIGELGRGRLPQVCGVIAALEAEGQRASVTFTQEAWSTIHRTLDRDFPGQQIVGWYHSHPGFGIFLSSADRFIHENFFSDPAQIAYVVDPQAGTEGLFHWRRGELVELWQGAADRRGTGRQAAGDGFTDRMSG
jgi:proteasome lid subunit RPN8/RPN11